jgi:uncharacterized membrane protein
MMEGFLVALTLLSALGCGLVAGILLHLLGLRDEGSGTPPVKQGIAAMQAINNLIIECLAYSGSPSSR